MRSAAQAIREEILSIANRAKSPHIGSALSCADILTLVYGELLYLPRAEDGDFAKRDIFLLSKAHSAMALYASLYHYGYMSKEQVEGYYRNGGTLPAHTDKSSSPYIEMSAGSLGHGLPIALGMALSLKGERNAQGSSRKVITLMGDGEVQEGSVWEAAMLAPKYELNNLIALIDRNDLQGYGRASELLSYEPLEMKWQAFGWEAVRVDGHDIGAMKACIELHLSSGSKKPLCVICETTKGKGVEFMEDRLEWHYYLVTDEVYKRALDSLRVNKEGHSALSDKSAIEPHYFGDRFHTLSPRASAQSPDLSSQILECQAESYQKDSMGVSESDTKDSKTHSESTPADSKNTSNPRTISESTLSHSCSISKYPTLDSHSLSCHSEPLGEESINHASKDTSAFSKPQYDKELESYPHASLESTADSERASAVGHCPTAIESMGAESEARSDSLSRPLRGVQKSEKRRAVVSRRRFLARSGNSKALPLIAEKKKRSFILFGAKGSGEGINPFSFCDTRFKESRESKEAKAKDSEKVDLESERQASRDISPTAQYDNDSESKGRTESAPSVIASNAKQSIKIDSKNLEFTTDSESKKPAGRDISGYRPQYDKGQDFKIIDCHAGKDISPFTKPQYDNALDFHNFAESATIRDSNPKHPKSQAIDPTKSPTRSKE